MFYRRRMNYRTLARSIRSAAKHQLDRGKITAPEFYQLMGASHSREYVMEAKAKLEAEGAPWTNKVRGVVEFDIQSLADWFAENWPKILQILQTIMVILPLFMDDLDKDEQ